MGRSPQQRKAWLTLSVVVVWVTVFCAREAETQLSVSVYVPGLITAGLAALTGSWKRGKMNILGTTCSYKTRPSFRKFRLRSKATVSCGKLGINKTCRKRRSKKAIRCAVEKVVKQAIQDGKVTAQQAANSFKQ